MTPTVTPYRFLLTVPNILSIRIKLHFTQAVYIHKHTQTHSKSHIQFLHMEVNNCNKNYQFKKILLINDRNERRKKNAMFDVVFVVVVTFFVCQAVS